MPDGLSRRKLLALLGLSTTTGCLRFAGDETANETSGAGARGGSPRGTQATTRTLRPTATPTPRQGTATQGENTPRPTQTATATADATVTDTPGETATATGAEGQETVTDVTYPPGMTENTVTRRLLDTHMRQLRRGANFTAVFRDQDESYGNTYVDEWTGKVESEDKMKVNMNFSHSDATVYRGTDGVYQRAEEEEMVLYSYLPLDKYPFPMERAMMAGRMHSMIRGGDYQPTRAIKRDGQTIIQIAAGDIKRADELLDLAYESDSVSSFAGEGEVAERGVIQALTGTAEFEGGETSSVTQTLETKAIGSTTVQTPDWKSSVKDKQPKLSVSLTDDAKFIRIEQTGGQSVPRDLRFNANWFSQDRYAYGRAESGISDGQTLYVYKEGSNRLGHSYGEKPSTDPEPFSGEFTLDIWVFALKLDQQEFTV